MLALSEGVSALILETVLFAPGLILMWVVVLLFKRTFRDKTLRLESAAGANDPYVLIANLQPCLRSWMFSNQAREEEIPSVQDPAGFYEFFHTKVMDKTDQMPLKEGYENKLYALIALWVAMMFILNLTTGRGIASFSIWLLPMYLIGVLFILEIIYLARQASLFYQQARHLFYEIDIRFTTIIHPGQAVLRPTSGDSSA